MSALASLLVYGRLPERIAIHWGTSGAANGWAPRPIGAFGVPVMMLLLGALVYLAPRIDPYREAYEKVPGSPRRVYGILLAILVAIHGVTLAVALGADLPTRRVIPAIVGLLLIGLGNELPRVRRNAFVGIRTPWTMASPDVFSRTQRVSGYLFVIAGLLFLTTSVVPAPWVSTMAAIAVGATVVSALVYSAVKSTNA